MKEKIIEESLKSLRQEGLRFSVDTLAERLRISKKTIYKHFPTKEVLALAMYEKYYRDLEEKVRDISLADETGTAEVLLSLYFDSAKMCRKEIFNKYCLNAAIGDFALQNHWNIWNGIKPCICRGMDDEEAEIYKWITDGAFDQAIQHEAGPKAVIGMLRKIK